MLQKALFACFLLATLSISTFADDIITDNSTPLIEETDEQIEKEIAAIKKQEAAAQEKLNTKRGKKEYAKIETYFKSLDVESIDLRNELMEKMKNKINADTSLLEGIAERTRLVPIVQAIQDKREERKKQGIGPKELDQLYEAAPEETSFVRIHKRIQNLIYMIQDEAIADTVKEHTAKGDTGVKLFEGASSLLRNGENLVTVDFYYNYIRTCSSFNLDPTDAVTEGFDKKLYHRGVYVESCVQYDLPTKITSVVHLGVPTESYSVFAPPGMEAPFETADILENMKLLGYSGINDISSLDQFLAVRKQLKAEADARKDYSPELPPGLETPECTKCDTDLLKFDRNYEMPPR